MRAKRKLLSLLLVLCMVLTLMPTVVFAGDDLDRAYYTGAEVTVDFTIANNSGFNHFIAEVNYDSDALELEKISAADLITANGGIFEVDDSKANCVTFRNATKGITDDGVLFSAKFKIKDAAVNGGAYPVTADVTAAHVGDADTSITITGGAIRVIRPGSLTVSKTVSGGGADTKKEFTFKVFAYDQGDSFLDGKYGDMVFKDGEATFTLHHGQSIEATGFLGNYYYSVQEVDNEGYTVTAKVNGEEYNGGATLGKEDYVVGSADRGEARDDVVVFDNYKAGGGGSAVTPTYPLTLSKQVTGLASVPSDYAVTLDITNRYGTVVRTLTLGADESKTLFLPYGEYTISETATEVEGYTLSSQEFSDNAFILSNDGKSVNITNVYTEIPDEIIVPSEDENGDDTDTPAPVEEPKDDTSDDADENVPKTGEENNLGIWTLLALLSISGMALVFVRKRIGRSGR